MAVREGSATRTSSARTRSRFSEIDANSYGYHPSEAGRRDLDAELNPTPSRELDPGLRQDSFVCRLRWPTCEEL